MILNILIIIISIVYIWNHSGFIFDMTKLIYKKLNPTKKYIGQSLPKPLGCYTCMTFWSILIYSLFNITIIYALGIAVLSAILSVIFNNIFFVLFKIIDKIK